MDQSVSQLFNPIIRGIKQYHTSVATVIIAIVVAAAVIRLYQLVALSSIKGVEGYAPTQKVDASFDQKTIDRVNSLKTVDDTNDTLAFPKRPSPFVE